MIRLSKNTTKHNKQHNNKKHNKCLDIELIEIQHTTLMPKNLPKPYRMTKNSYNILHCQNLQFGDLDRQFGNFGSTKFLNEFLVILERFMTSGYLFFVG